MRAVQYMICVYVSSLQNWDFVKFYFIFIRNRARFVRVEPSLFKLSFFALVTRAKDNYRYTRVSSVRAVICLSYLRAGAAACI